MATKKEKKPFEEWNQFGDQLHLLNEGILKLRADLDRADTNYRIELENTPDHPTAERMLAQVNELEGLLS